MASPAAQSPATAVPSAFPELIEVVDETSLQGHGKRCQPEGGCRACRDGERVAGVADGEEETEREQPIGKPAHKREREGSPHGRASQDLADTPGVEGAGMRSSPMQMLRAPYRTR